MIKSIVPAALLSLFICSPAWAAPISPATTTTHLTTAEIVPVQWRDRDDRRYDRRFKPDRRYDRRFTPGQRYRSAPRGYKRHGYRPNDWRTRGCITVGPVWFCP